MFVDLVHATGSIDRVLKQQSQVSSRHGMMVDKNLRRRCWDDDVDGS